MFRLGVCLVVVLFANVRSEELDAFELVRNANAILGPLDEPPNPVPEPDPTPNKPLQDGDECDLDSLFKIVCENDRLQFCGPNNKIMSTPCVINGRQGYCNCEKNECVAEKPSCSQETTKCLTPKTKLPDNMNCHKFSYCNENKEKTTYECPGNLIYDPTLERCMDQNTSPCNRVVCPRPGTRLQLIPFPQARNYYVLCFQGVGDVRKCPFKSYAVRNNKCQFDCKMQGQSGLFKDTDVTRCRQGYYYSCRRAGTNFTTVQAKCPEGKTFDETIGLCTAEDTCDTN